MAKTKTQPELRFAGFTEDWDEKEFDKVFTNISNNSLSRDKLNYNTGLAKNVHYGDILVKFNEVLDVKKEILPYVSDNENVEKQKNNFLKDGDIIISDAAEDETVGKCVELFNVKDEKILSGLHTIAVRPKETFASKYLGYYMNSNSYHDQLLQLMQGTKVLSISKTALKKTIIKNPQIKEEQKLIGNFFENLDKLITEHQQKHTKLKSLKQAMLDKMFPKQGQTVPEIRFKGFEGDWEVKKLGEVANFRRGSFPQPYGLPEWYDEENGMPFIQVFDVDENMQLKSFTKNKISELGAFQSVFVNMGTLVVTIQGSIGRVAKTQYDAYVDRTLLIFQSYKAKVDVDYFKYVVFILFEIEKTKAPGGTIKTITKEVLTEFKIHLPCIEEQYKIGKYFDNIEHLITNHETQITKLQNIKKALLAKMFI